MKAFFAKKSIYDCCVVFATLQDEAGLVVKPMESFPFLGMAFLI